MSRPLQLRRGTRNSVPGVEAGKHSAVASATLTQADLVLHSRPALGVFHPVVLPVLINHLFWECW